MSEYRIRHYITRGAGRSPIPMHSIVFVRNVTLNDIYAVNIGGRGSGYTFEHFNGENWTIYTGDIFVDTSAWYMAAWASENDRARIIPLARNLLQNTTGSRYLVRPSDRDRRAHRLIIERFNSTPLDATDNFRNALANTLNEIGERSDANRTLSTTDPRELMRTNREMIDRLSMLINLVQSGGESLTSNDPVSRLRDSIIHEHPQLRSSTGLPGHNPIFIGQVSRWRDALLQQLVDYSGQLQRTPQQ